MSISRLIDGFLLDREAERRTAATLRHHRLSLGLFEAWLEAEGLPDDPARWTPNDVRAYFAHLQHRPSRDGRPLAGHSVTSYATSVRAFLRWCHEEGYADRNLVDRIRKPKPPKLVKQPFSQQEAQALIKAAQAEGRNGLRDAAIVLFMLDSGARAAEVCGLREDTINWRQRVALIRGKGDKERLVPFSPATMRAMHKYLVKGRRGGSPEFFQSEEGRPLQPTGLHRLVKRLGKRAAVDDAYPHRFRRTAAVTFLRNGGDLLTLKRLLGHEDLTTTERYLALTAADVAAAHQAHSPVESLIAGKAARTTRGA